MSSKNFEGREFLLSVGSANQYNDLIAEITFPGKFGAIISQEKKQGEYEVSFHSFSPSSGVDFNFTRNISSAKVPLKSLVEALDVAVYELDRLKRS